MACARLTHTGMGDGTYADVPAYATFNISGMGNVTITGKVGKGAVINKSGMGNLYIQGTVDEDVAFQFSGMGNIFFAKRPPESVISKISKSGMGNIEMPGGFVIKAEPRPVEVYSSPSFTQVISGVSGDYIDSITSNNGIVEIKKNGITTRYAGRSTSIINGTIYIDGIAVTPDDSRIIREEKLAPQPSQPSSPPAPYAPSYRQIIGQIVSQTFANIAAGQRAAAVPPAPVASAPQPSVVVQPPVAELSKEEKFLQDCSVYTKQYLSGFVGKQKFSEIIAELKLSEEELAYFESKCEDSITRNVMDRPVTLNERVYDFATILGFNGIEPETRLEFTARDIGPSRQTVAEIEKIITRIKEERRIAESSRVSPSM